MKFPEEKLPISSHTRYKYRYLDLRYEEKDGYFYVSCNDLPQGSPILEKRKCDCCGEEYIREHEKHEITFKRFGIDICPSCVKSNKNIRDKIQEKKEKTWKEKYGCHPMQTDEIKEKVFQSYEEKYGGHPMKNKEIKDKWVSIVTEKYGGLSPLCSEEVREKAQKTMNENNLVATSSQQKEILNLLLKNFPESQCNLNFPESKLYLDILFIYNNIKIDVEYDGSHWHKNRQQEDRRRDEFLKSKGYKIFRIKSAHCIPSIEQLQQKINILINSDKRYTEIILSDW